MPRFHTDHHGACREFDHTDSHTYSFDGDCTDTGVNPVHGAWSTWTAQGSCSASCGDGSQTYTRTCDGIVNGGNDCSGLDGGSATKTESCKIKECPVNGAWSGWTASGSCSASCGNGLQSYTRTCGGIAHGGNDCSQLDGGSSTKTESCKIKECPINGAWSGWSGYGGCSRSCEGTQTRTRSCTNPRPQHGGANCGGSSSQSISCGGSCKRTFNKPKYQGYYFHQTTSGSHACRKLGYSNGRTTQNGRRGVCKIWYTNNLRNMGCGNSEPYLKQIECW